MITVIRHGFIPKRTIECSKCSCIFTCEEDDIKQTPISRFIICPECSNIITVN